MTTKIWLDDPLVLFKKGEINQVWPTQNMDKNQKVNAITRLVIILSILGYLITNSFNFFFTGFLTLGVIILLYYAPQIKKEEEEVEDRQKKEGFTNPKLYRNR